MSEHWVQGASEPSAYSGDPLTVEGVFLGELVKVEERLKRKDTGVDQLEVELTLMVTDTASPEDGKTIRDWFYPDTKALYRLQLFLKVMGLPYKDDFRWNPDEWIGRPVVFESYVDHFGGRDRLKVRHYQPAPQPEIPKAVLPPPAAVEDTP